MDSTQATILYADACGYAAAAAQSELLAITRLKLGQHLLEKTVGAFGGRVVDMSGDSALMTFNTAPAAYCAADSFRNHARDMHKNTNIDVPFDYRFGMTQGKIFVDGHKVFGHAINQAARIESLVSKNCIGVEDSVWNEVQPSAGNVQYEMRVLFSKHLEPAVKFIEVQGETSERATLKRPARNHPSILIIAHSDFVIDAKRDGALDAVIWECKTMFAAQDWHATVMHHATLDESYAERDVDYIVRIRVTQVRGNARIAIALSSRHTNHATQSFAREAASEDEIVRTAIAVAALTVSAISHTEGERALKGIGAGSAQLVFAGRTLVSSFKREQMEQGMAYLNKACEIDPDYPLLWASLARAHAIMLRYEVGPSGVDHLAVATEFAEKAVGLSPNDGRLQADLGFVRFWNNRTMDSVWHYDRALEVLPFHPELAADAGMVLSYVGRNSEAADILERSVLNLPSDADYRLWSLGDAYFAMKDYKNALKWLSRMSNQEQAQRLLAACKGRLGLDPSSHVKEVLRQQPNFSVRKWVELQPFALENDQLDFQEALLLAGLPP
jgi:tetratricopeptide (TPR) repeat protein